MTIQIRPARLAGDTAGPVRRKVKKYTKNCPLAMMEVASSYSVLCCKKICLASKIPEATTSRTPSSVCGRDDGAFDNDGQFPDEESLVADDGKDSEWRVVDDRKVPVQDNSDNGGGVPHGDPDAADTFPTPMKNLDAWSRRDVCAASPPRRALRSRPGRHHGLGRRW